MSVINTTENLTFIISNIIRKLDSSQVTGQFALVLHMITKFIVKSCYCDIFESVTMSSCITYCGSV